MVRVAGLEPATFRLTIGCATIAPHPNTETRLYFVFTVVQPYFGWGSRVRTYDNGVKVRCVTSYTIPQQRGLDGEQGLEP